MASVYERSIQYLKGVGEKRAQLYHKLGVTTVGALLRHYPRAYEDWSNPLPIAEATSDAPCCIKAKAVTAPQEHRVRKGMTLYRFAVTDGASVMRITLFNNKYAAGLVTPGEEYIFYGKVTGIPSKPEMSAPDFEPLSKGQRIRPIYPQTEGLSSRTIEMAVRQALTLVGDDLNDVLPDTLRREHSLCHLRFALQNIHLPASHEALAAARRRLAFEELLTLQLGLLQLRGRSRSGSVWAPDNDQSDAFFALLPFAPTNAQRRAVREALTDMRSGLAMNRLLQGDVGSGKTAVAAALCHTVAKNGRQAALMAPTEILAEQHYRSLQTLLEPAGIRTGLLTGSLPAAGKRAVREALALGGIDLVVGTHALLQDDITFFDLGLVITDEQHRFGVDQRARLVSKGESVHTLVMSATPIPRTLALFLYGDLDVSVLDEMPPGRTPVETYAINSGKRQRAFGFIQKHLAAGRQAYIVCPLVEEGASELAAAEQYAARLRAGDFAGFAVGLLHGRLKPAQKDAVMQSFARGETQLLVATTVVEVGVDVPNATVMLIENAERFGLSQLHQLRGRVGRGRHASCCILVSDAENPEAIRRLEVMCRTQDGFKIAEEDLRLRGPGDFFGHRQHGLPALKIADLTADMVLCRDTQAAARAILAADPTLSHPAHQGLAGAVAALFHNVGEGGLN